MALVNEGERELCYGVVQTKWGRALIGMVGEAVARLLFAERNTSDEALLEMLEWDSDLLKRDDVTIEWVAARVFGDNPYVGNEIPLFLDGTEFQRKVWDELLNIEKGQVMTYGALATKIGRPSAARAVGTAVGGNRIAYLVPCHRVIPVSGGVGNYRWGASLKAELLQFERD